MLTRYIIGLILLSFISLSSIAQDTALAGVYYKDRIYLEKRNKFSINGSSMHIDNIATYLYKSKEAMKAYNKFEKTGSQATHLPT